MLSRIIFALLLVACSVCNVAAAEEPDAQIHQELRGVLKQVESAINSGNYDAMLPVLSENLRITPINQEFLSNRKEVSCCRFRGHHPKLTPPVFQSRLG